MQRRTLAFALMALILYAFVFAPVHATPLSTQQRAKIELSLSHQVLRGQLMFVSGRLSTTVGDYPIALAKVRLQYYRAGETDFTREVAMITSNPGGLFADMFNTTSLLRIGTWIVNASFPSQLGYESTSTADTFTVVVQPALSLYISSDDIAFGQNVTFNGLLFACIPCIQDEVTVTFSRPDNTSISMPVRVTPTGGPYPGGYYNGTFTPDVPGVWLVRAVWKGNEVTLPAYSQVDKIQVELPATRPDTRGLLYTAGALAVAAVIVLVVLLRRRRSRNGSA